MSSCGHSTIFCFLPPTLTFLSENFNTLIPNTSINRRHLRCRLCDLLDTQALANLAETSQGLESEADIEKQILELKEAITEGTQKDTGNALPRLQKKMNDAVKATDQRIIEAWKGHWAIWGPGEGPDRADEEVWDVEIEIEFPDEEIKAEEKVQIPSEAAGKAAVKRSIKASADRSSKKSKK
ncbi:hypothetical protein WAI453_000756 [Rhynchosporium graminicola]|uniref:Uncharacterized protein n=2 Tax=Rhynchosporium TaxID=38037 RepID=A0A1E1MK66_RHYSE|nr:uncharacterized protein RCO7_01280 [Rhynchosporium commune]CZT49450.1 uncharacterized protein RSE6_10301 [Rhynchosporium secalis]